MVRGLDDLDNAISKWMFNQKTRSSCGSYITELLTQIDAALSARLTQTKRDKVHGNIGHFEIHTACSFKCLGRVHVSLYIAINLQKPVAHHWHIYAYWWWPWIDWCWQMSNIMNVAEGCLKPGGWWKRLFLLSPANTLLGVLWCTQAQTMGG